MIHGNQLLRPTPLNAFAATYSLMCMLQKLGIGALAIRSVNTANDGTPQVSRYSMVLPSFVSTKEQLVMVPCDSSDKLNITWSGAI